LLSISATAMPNNPNATQSFKLQLGGPAAEGHINSLMVASSEPPIARIFPDGKSLITTGTMATVWNLTTGEPWRWGLLTGHKGPVVDAELSADGKRIATLASGTGRSMEVRVWEVPSDPNASGSACKILFEYNGTPVGGDLSGDGKLMLMDEGSGRIEIWDVDTGRRLGTIPGANACFSPDGKRIASAEQSKIGVYLTDSLQPMRTLTIPGSIPQHLCWGPKGQSLFFVNGGWVSCVDAETGRELIECKFSSADER